jgi:hypothetical protein
MKNEKVLIVCTGFGVVQLGSYLPLAMVIFSSFSRNVENDVFNL